MDIPHKGFTFKLAAWDLINMVGVLIELKELDADNSVWYDGYKDALVRIINEATGTKTGAELSALLKRPDLDARIQDFLMENKIESILGDEN